MRNPPMSQPRLRCRCGFDGPLGDRYESYVLWRDEQRAWERRVAARVAEYLEARVQGTAIEWLDANLHCSCDAGELLPTEEVVTQLMGLEDRSSIDLQRCPSCARLYLEAEDEGAIAYVIEDRLAYAALNPHMTADDVIKLVLQGDVTALRTVLEAGAGANHVDADGMSALQVAVASKRRDVVELLLAHGADPNGPSETAPLYLAREPSMIALLLERDANPDWQTKNGETALTFAAHEGDLEVVELLLAGGADPNVPSAAWPPLFYAAMAGHLAVVKLLLDRGADPLRIDEGRTCLAIAADHAKWDVAEILLERAPAIASLGSVDPAGIAREKGELALAAKIDELR